MVFDSLLYLLFLPVVYLLFLLVSRGKARVSFLLASSYVFYACWNPYYLGLIVFSTVVDYFCSMQIGESSHKTRRKLFLVISLFSNLGLLFFFKYYNFFIDSFAGPFGIEAGGWGHNFLLPVGISFYTFQTIGYTIDVYRRDIEPETNFLQFALYVSFFPQLVAGPIERAKNILPQLSKAFTFSDSQFSSALKLILLGLIQKIVFANHFGSYVNVVFDNPEAYAGLPLLLGCLLFAFQIYYDFSGYTNIAIGSARLFGIDLMENFKGPYLCSSIREFWRRWHISLSTWFRDYLYISLGGNRVSTFKVYRNLLIVFVITGLWHGANWTFVIWGLIHGFFIIIERLGFDKVLKNLPRSVSVSYTFVIVCFAWIFFRAENLDKALMVLSSCTQVFPFAISDLGVYTSWWKESEYWLVIVLLIIAIASHYWSYRDRLLDLLFAESSAIRYLKLSCLVLFLLIFGRFYDTTEFIYFQF